MLMLRAATARAASTVVAGARRRPVLLPVAVAGLSSSSSGPPPSGGKRRKGQRRSEAKPQPQPSEIASNKKANARPARDRKACPVAEEEAQGPSGQAQEIELRKQQPEKEKPKRVVRWRCATGCGACCKLDKGPEFPTPDEVFADYPDHLQLYKSMIGPDGWCTNYDKSNRTCNIYEDRPFFCRVEPKVFEEFFGVPRSKFDREACSACVDNIKMVYGQDSPELGNFKRVIREESSKHESSMNQVKLLDTTNAGT